MKYIHFFFCLLLGTAVQAQIKIGDNPQNIDPSSVLELESSSRVLVITRVSTAQMNAITPSAGAMVYNTDIECIHYYTGTEWKDICDAVAGSITFTSDDGTVVITSTGGNNYDLKVGEITGLNIVNETVFGADIATATIGERQLAPNSVGTSELQDNTVGKDEIQEAAVGTLEIIDGTIKPEDIEPGAFDQLLTTDAGGNVVWLNKNELGATQADQTTITGAGTATDPIKVADTVIGDILANATAITTNANNIAQNSNDIAANTNNIAQNSTAITANTNDIAANTAALLTKEDLANKSDDTALGNSTDLYPTQNAVKTYVDQVTGAASTLTDGNIFVGSAGNVATGVAMNGDATIDNTGFVTISDLAITSAKIALNAVGQPHLADNAVISSKILNGNVTPIKIQPGASNEIMTTNSLGVVTWQPIAAVGGNQDLASVLGFGTNAGGNQINNLADPTAPQDAATLAYVDSRTDGSETEINPGTNITITGNGTTATPYIINAADGVVPDGSETEINAGTNITVTGNGTTATPYVISGTVSIPDGSETEINPGTNITITGNGTTATPYIINGTVNAPDGSETIIDAINSTIGVTGTGTSGNPYVLTGSTGNPAAADVTFAPTPSTTSANVQLAIEELQTEIDGLTATGTNPNDELITNLSITGTTLNILEAGTNFPLDLDPTFVTEVELSAFSVDDADADPANEIQNITSSDNSVTVTPTGANDFDLSVVGATDNQNLTGATLTGSNLTIDIEDGTSAVADLSALATDAELAALNVDDADADPANEIQILTLIGNSLSISSGNSVTLTLSGSQVNPAFGAQNISTSGTLAAGTTTITGDINISGSVFRAAVDLHPDYVFQKYFLGNSSLKESYDFQTLAEIEAFVKKHHHLPGIKSAEEVEQDGYWNLSESNLQNLEKIEELFLHTIEQEKKIEQLKTENQSLSAELESLRKDMDEIKVLLKNKN
jgi:hypothetical protein